MDRNVFRLNNLTQQVVSFEVQSSSLTLETAVDKTVLPQGPFSRCSATFVSQLPCTLAVQTFHDSNLPRFSIEVIVVISLLYL